MSTTTIAIGENFGARLGQVVGGLVGGGLGSFAGPGGVIVGRFVGAKVGEWGGRVAGGWVASQMDNANEKAEPTQKEDSKTQTDKKMPECKGDCKEEEEDKKKAAKKRAKEIHDNPEQFEGQDKSDVERQLDKELRDDAGWNKEPLKKGTGSKYTSPEGNQQMRLNDGYPQGSNRGASDPLHSGSYINVPSLGKQVPLKGNPALYKM